MAHDVLGEIPIVGCSGEGIIAGDASLEQDFAAAVLLFASDRATCRSYVVPEYGSAPAEAGKVLAEQVRSQCAVPPALLCVFTDGLQGDCTAFLAALQGELSPETVLVGGAAADDMQFLRTTQFGQGAVHEGAVTALTLEGDIDAHVVLSHGCEPLGLERTVTDSDTGWVRAIDENNAWQEFRSYLGEEVEDLHADGIAHLCLGQTLAPDDAYVVRTPLRLDQADGSLFFPGGGMEQGTAFRMMRRDPDTIACGVADAAQALRAVAEQAAPVALLQFDCAGRGRSLFGNRAGETLVAPIRAHLGQDLPLIGFHTYGEIAPMNGVVRYHNYTAAYCLITERPQRPGTTR